MAEFDYDKTYGPEGGSFVVDYPGGSVTVPSGKVLKWEFRRVPVIADPPPPKKKEASATAKSVGTKATTKSAKKRGSK